MITLDKRRQQEYTCPNFNFDISMITLDKRWQEYTGPNFNFDLSMITLDKRWQEYTCPNFNFDLSMTRIVVQLYDKLVIPNFRLISC